MWTVKLSLRWAKESFVNLLMIIVNASVLCYFWAPNSYSNMLLCPNQKYFTSNSTPHTHITSLRSSCHLVPLKLLTSNTPTISQWISLDLMVIYSHCSLTSTLKSWASLSFSCTCSENPQIKRILQSDFFLLRQKLLIEPEENCIQS